jgi:hypothetical protein
MRLFLVTSPGGGELMSSMGQLVFPSPFANAASDSATPSLLPAPLRASLLAGSKAHSPRVSVTLPLFSPSDAFNPSTAAAAVAHSSMPTPGLSGPPLSPSPSPLPYAFATPSVLSSPLIFNYTSHHLPAVGSPLNEEDFAFPVTRFPSVASSAPWPSSGSAKKRSACMPPFSPIPFNLGSAGTGAAAAGGASSSSATSARVDKACSIPEAPGVAARAAALAVAANDPSIASMAAAAAATLHSFTSPKLFKAGSGGAGGGSIEIGIKVDSSLSESVPAAASSVGGGGGGGASAATGTALPVPSAPPSLFSPNLVVPGGASSGAGESPTAGGVVSGMFTPSPTVVAQAPTPGRLQLLKQPGGAKPSVSGFDCDAMAAAAALVAGIRTTPVSKQLPARGVAAAGMPAAAATTGALAKPLARHDGAAPPPASEHLSRLVGGGGNASAAAIAVASRAVKAEIIARKRPLSFDSTPTGKVAPPGQLHAGRGAYGWNYTPAGPVFGTPTRSDDFSALGYDCDPFSTPLGKRGRFATPRTDAALPAGADWLVDPAVAAAAQSAAALEASSEVGRNSADYGWEGKENVAPLAGSERAIDSGNSSFPAAMGPATVPPKSLDVSWSSVGGATFRDGFLLV